MKKFLLIITLLLCSLSYGQNLSKLSNSALANKAEDIAGDLENHNELSWIRKTSQIEMGDVIKYKGNTPVVVQQQSKLDIDAAKITFEAERKQSLVSARAVRTEMLRRLRKSNNEDDDRHDKQTWFGQMPYSARLYTLAIEVRKLP